MAIDTREKRQSAVSLLVPTLTPGVEPSSLDQAGRQASIWSYAGITAQIVAAVELIKLTLRIDEIDETLAGVIILRCVDEDPGIYTPPLTTVSGGFVQPRVGAAGGISQPGSTRLELLDIPLLRDQDDGSGFYAAVSGLSNSWKGTVLHKSGDGGQTFKEVETITTQAVIGSTTTVLASGPATVFDEINTVTVRLIRGSLSSDSEINVLNGANVCVIGKEIVQFKTATDNGDGTWTLSGLLRGRRGTENQVGSHAKNERFVLLTGGGILRVETDSAERGVLRHYKAVSIGTKLSSASQIPFINTDVGLKPYFPAHVAGSRDGSNNLTITWIRRTRIGGAWNDFSDVPLGEDSESYEVDILDAPGGNVLRTIAVTSQSASYTAAQQTADGLTPGNPVNVEIYQLSAAIGRGFKAAATV